MTVYEIGVGVAVEICASDGFEGLFVAPSDYGQTLAQSHSPVPFVGVAVVAMADKLGKQLVSEPFNVVEFRQVFFEQSQVIYFINL